MATVKITGHYLPRSGRTGRLGLGSASIAQNELVKGFDLYTKALAEKYAAQDVRFSKEDQFWRANKEVNHFTRAVQRIASAYLKYTFLSIGRVIYGDVPGLSAVEQGVSGQVRYTLPNVSQDHRVLVGQDHGRRISPKNAVRWHALSDYYINEPPRSLQFWRKRGRLERSFSASIKAIDKSFGPPQPHMSRVRRAHRAGYRVTIPFTVSYPDLGPIWTRYVMEPFILGPTSLGSFPVFSVGAGDRKTVKILTFLEQRRHRYGGRPFIKAISAEAGEEMRKALRRL